MAFTEDYKKLLRAQGKTEAEIAAMEAAAGGGNKTTSTKATDVSYPSVYSQTQSDAKITDIFQKLLDRDPTAAELKSWGKKLIAAQKENAARQTYKKAGTKATQTTVGGLDEDQWLTTELSKDPKYGPEIKRLASLDPKVRIKEQNKRDYEAALKEAGNNPAAIAALQSTTAYGIDIAGIKARIKSEADIAGATVDEATLQQIAEEAYNTNQDQDPVLLAKFINSKINIGAVAGQYKGEAADNYEKLFKLGIDNGINIETDPRFKGQVDGWLNEIKSGTPIENFEGIIRGAASENQPAFVQSLLKTGQNLNDIYGNYISRMADYFDIDESAIDINDPLLKKAFTEKGGMSFTQFEQLLSKDPRTKGSKKGQDVNNRQYIIDKAVEFGVDLSETDVEDILNTSIALGLSPASPAIEKLIRSKFNYQPGKAFGGKAGTTVIDLRGTAAANGIDLDKQFGGQLDGWVERVMQGESVDTFKNLIRQTAKIGMPENVAKLLDEGVDLDTVYSPYKNIMASILEINPETIRLDDPVLRSAITGQGEMTIYDYQRSLRKDPRWQYTNKAREEVSDVTLQVLRDFGLQG
jgi:hypothetical protein